MSDARLNSLTFGALVGASKWALCKKIQERQQMLPAENLPTERYRIGKMIDEDFSVTLKSAALL